LRKSRKIIIYGGEKTKKFERKKDEEEKNGKISARPNAVRVILTRMTCQTATIVEKNFLLVTLTKKAEESILLIPTKGETKYFVQRSVVKSEGKTN
jgi:hypothetical protein